MSSIVKNYDSLFKSFFGIDKNKLGPTYCDPATGQIVNAKEGSLIWWHEKGHLEYANRTETQNKDYSRQSMFKSTIFFTVVSLFFPIIKWFALMFLLATGYYAIYEEYWCWKYALYKHKKQQNKISHPEVLKFI